VSVGSLVTEIKKIVFSQPFWGHFEKPKIAGFLLLMTLWQNFKKNQP